MDEKKQFQKQKLDIEAHRGVEYCVKTLKGALGVTMAAVALVKNKEILKAISKNMLNVADRIVKK